MFTILIKLVEIKYHQSDPGYVDNLWERLNACMYNYVRILVGPKEG